MGNRTRAREQALQVLYLIELAQTKAEESIDLFKANFDSRDEEFQFMKTLVTGTIDKQEEIDALIESCSQNWRLSRIPRIDRNILRLGVFELIFCPEIPQTVILDEAIELGKKYGESKTGSFVNGVLDRASKQTRKTPCE